LAPIGQKSLSLAPIGKTMPLNDLGTITPAPIDKPDTFAKTKSVTSVEVAPDAKEAPPLGAIKPLTDDMKEITIKESNFNNPMTELQPGVDPKATECEVM
jgi:hypothetical protein